MKKILTAVAAVLLIAALLLCAMAETMIVGTDQAKVYKKNTKKSDVISRLPAGGSVDVYDIKGDWMHIHYINKKGVEKKGWIRAKDLKGGASKVKEKEKDGGDSGDGSHKHTWTDWRVTREATCTKAGRKEHTCTTCGVTKEKEIEKASHQWGKWSTNRKATCEKAGEKVRKCKVCGKKDTSKIAKTDHSFGPWTIDQQPTCSEEGVQSHTCSICGAKKTEVMEKLDHTFGEWTMTTALTRATDGERVHACKVCGLQEQEAVKAEPGFARKDKGDGVRGVQNMLNDLGYNAGRVDGAYGPKLDKAFEAFAMDAGVSFASGYLMPAQLDALATRWVKALPEDKWMGEREGLTLTVTPKEGDDGVRGFDWTLTKGDKTGCTLRAVLMGVGGGHDFRSEDMAVVLDLEKVKSGNSNGLKGSFTIPEKLGDGEMLSFAAVVEADKTGEVWLSNTVEIE